MKIMKSSEERERERGDLKGGVEKIREVIDFIFLILNCFLKYLKFKFKILLFFKFFASYNKY